MRLRAIVPLAAAAPDDNASEFICANVKGADKRKRTMSTARVHPSREREFRTIILGILRSGSIAIVAAGSRTTNPEKGQLFRIYGISGCVPLVLLLTLER